MSDIVTIAGSPSRTSRSSAVLGHAREFFRRYGLHSEAIEIRDFNAEDLLYAQTSNLGIQAGLVKVDRAKVVIIATPVYKAAYSGALKTFLDVLPQQALKDKIVLPIATGGTLAHLLSIDYALKPVLSALGAQHILSGLYVVDSQCRFADGGAFHLDAEVENRLQGAFQTIVNHLIKTDFIPSAVGGDF